MDGSEGRFRPSRRIWVYLPALVYVLALCLTSWVEAFGPADAGLLYTVRYSATTWPSFEVEDVLAGSPLAQAGARSGDVIETAGGYAICGQTDWFVARSHFEVDKPIRLQIRRGVDELTLTFTITRRNWRTWTLGVIAFRVARVIVLLVALIVAFSRPGHLGAGLVALLFAIVSVAEAFPPAGWAAALRHWPPLFAIPVAIASVSWLLIGVPWLMFCLTFPRPQFRSRWVWGLVLTPVAIFLPLLLLSAVAVIYAPRLLAMPTPFLDVEATRRLQSVWGVIPTLFINPWPFYRPAPHAILLELWAVVSIAFSAGGTLATLATSGRVAEGAERRRARFLAFAQLAVWVMGIHNVFVRNWQYWFGSRPPTVFSVAGLALEAGAASLIAVALAYAVVKRRSV